MMAAAFKSREDHRKQLELEEARKAGLAPAELDEDGKEINPHIPQYMSSAPWYLNAERPVCLIFKMHSHSFNSMDGSMPLILVVLSESGFPDKVFTIQFICVPQFICLVFFVYVFFCVLACTRV